MPKRGLRVLPLSLGMLCGALCALIGARTASAQTASSQTTSAQEGTTRANITLKAQVSSAQMFPLEPLVISVTVTNNGDEPYSFGGWEGVETRFQLKGSEFCYLGHFYFTGVSNLSTTSFTLGPHQSRSNLCVVRSVDAENPNAMFSRPGLYEVRHTCNTRPNLDLHIASTSLEICALPPEEALAYSYLQRHELFRYFTGGRQKLFRVTDPKRNPDGTERFGEAERDLLVQLQDFLWQFPHSRYVPWVKLAMFHIAYEQWQREATLLKSLKEELGLNQSLLGQPLSPTDTTPNTTSDTTTGTTLTAEEKAARLAEKRLNVLQTSKTYSPALLYAVLAGQPTPLHDAHDLQSLKEQVVTTAPLLPPPVQSRAWILAAQLAITQGADEATVTSYLDEALATGNEPSLPAEIALAKPILLRLRRAVIHRSANP